MIGALAVVALLGAPAHDVDVVIGGPPDQANALRPVLAELLDPYDVHYDRTTNIDVDDVVTPGPTSDVEIGRVWVDLTTENRATLYVVDAPWQRVYVRHFTTQDPPDEVTREQIGHAIEAAIDTLHAGGEIGIFVKDLNQSGSGGAPGRNNSVGPRAGTSVDDAGSPYARTSAASPTGTSPVALWLGAGYRASFWSRSPVVYHGPLLSFAIARAGGRVRPGAAVFAQYVAPAVLDADSLTLQLQGASLRALVTLGVPVSKVTFRTALGAAVDLVRARTTASGPGTARPAFTHATPLVAAHLGVGVPLTPRLQLAFDATLDVDLVDTHYWADQASAPIFDPWVPRPGFRISIRGNVIDPDRRRVPKK